ncbi:MAG: hypothetical protein ACOY0T_16715 [Myxococcota bacterium]
MPTNRNRPDPIRPAGGITFVLAASLSFGLACAESKSKDDPTPGNEGPFKSVEVVANAPSSYSSPRGGVPLSDGGIAFIATLEGTLAAQAPEGGERIAILRKGGGAQDVQVLYSGDQLVNPLDIAISLDEKTLYLADPAGGAEGSGAILTLAISGGEPSELLAGYAPRAVTVADDGRVYFSGVDPESREAGVFELRDGVAVSAFQGAPLVDPSGIAVQADGTLLVADTRLFERTPGVGSEAGIVRIKQGQASIWATGFSTGYPAGIALTLDEKTLIISGEGPDRSDTVYLVDMAKPSAPPQAITASFSAYQDASAGLKRAHDSNTFIWASLAADGGTVFRIVAN